MVFIGIHNLVGKQKITGGFSHEFLTPKEPSGLKKQAIFMAADESPVTSFVLPSGCFRKHS